MQAEYIEV